MVTVVVDVNETPSGIGHMLEDLGAFVVFKRLDAGDYLPAPGCLVERKSVLDLHYSLRGGRLWRQVGRLRTTARFPYLLVEGPVLEGPLDTEAVRGALT